MFTSESVPVLTRDRTDDPIVYGALLSGADFLISDDRDIVPDRAEQIYAAGDLRVRAVTFGHVLRHCFEPPDFPWPEIDGRWLARTD